MSETNGKWKGILISQMRIGRKFVKHNGNLQAQPCGENCVGRMLLGSLLHHHRKKHQGKGISAGDHVGKRKLTTTIFWGGCQKLTPYWQEIKRNVEAVFEVEIVFNCDSIFG